MDFIRMNCQMAEFFKKAKNGHGRMKSFGFLILPCRKWPSAGKSKKISLSQVFRYKNLFDRVILLMVING